MDESQMCDTKLEKPDSESCLLEGSIYMSFWKRLNYRDRKQIRRFLGKVIHGHD